MLYIMAVATLNDLGFKYHGYADDIQAYMHFLSDQQSITLTVLQFHDCIVQIMNWLKLFVCS